MGIKFWALGCPECNEVLPENVFRAATIEHRELFCSIQARLPREIRDKIFEYVTAWPNFIVINSDTSLIRDNWLCWGCDDILKELFETAYGINDFSLEDFPYITNREHLLGKFLNMDSLGLGVQAKDHVKKLSINVGYGSTRHDDIPQDEFAALQLLKHRAASVAVTIEFTSRDYLYIRRFEYILERFWSSLKQLKEDGFKLAIIVNDYAKLNIQDGEFWCKALNEQLRTLDKKCCPDYGWNYL